ncbi:GNAT family N-acetyltransferase [Chromobacterium vaccinii]|uniref:GNAT family N-acetyltransferase n=1 Tax=Chromobacterium vaccinii TaxID=1108595 RepID=UPI000CE98DA1|nr:GNAT family N-acetyltransferase [Chromobacterium vaccinii]AVG16033.1 GNAT family N-acetyltransferase [Chromobacterium vaccinii]
MIIRPVDRNDYEAWRPLWDGYNAFYGRAGETALPENITRQTWARFLDEREPVDALVAELDGKIVGLAHTIIHRSTTRLADVCYLQDLFTAPEARGQGVARALIDAAKQVAAAAGCNRLYWQTHQTNQTARALYDKVAAHQGFIVYGSDVPA